MNWTPGLGSVRLPIHTAFAIATVVGVVMAVEVYVPEVLGHTVQTPLWQALLRNVTVWWLWAGLSPIIFYVCRAFPPNRKPWPLPLLMHLGAAVGVSLLHSLIYVPFIVSILWPSLLDSLPAMYRKNFIPNLTGDLFTYAAIAGSFLAYTYSRSYREQRESNRDLAERASDLQARLTSAELAALQAQMQPHFLFNTLNSIGVLVLRGDGKDAIRTLELLGDVLRGTLRKREHLVPLRDELELVDRYLQIERVRLGNRLQVSIRKSDDVEDALVPPLILQPLVENAIRHGVSALAEAGRIDLRAVRVDGSLRLEVSDDGPGFRAESGAGVGLANARERLRQLFGEGAHLVTGNGQTGGALVTVVLPFRTWEATQ